jgi:hypothetical protein
MPTDNAVPVSLARGGRCFHGVSLAQHCEECRQDHESLGATYTGPARYPVPAILLMGVKHESD